VILNYQFLFCYVHFLTFVVPGRSSPCRPDIKYLYGYWMCWIFPLPTSWRHLSCDDCLEDRSEYYQNCSVLYCVPHLYTVISTHIWAVLIGVLATRDSSSSLTRSRQGPLHHPRMTSHDGSPPQISWLLLSLRTWSIHLLLGRPGRHLLGLIYRVFQKNGTPVLFLR